MRKLRIARLLMIATILLIVTFQVYWLTKLYYQEYDNLKRTTDVIFKESLYDLQVARFEKDTLFRGLPPSDLFSKNIVRVLKVKKDSTANRKQRSFIISMNETKALRGSDAVIIRDSTKSFQGDQASGRFMERLRLRESLHDSLPLASVDSIYHAALTRVNIELPFSLLILKQPQDGELCPGAFCTSRIPVGIFSQVSYMASFPDPWTLLINRIKVQGLLSLLLVVLTILSFVFIYRNLLAEKRLTDIKNDFISNITHELKTPIATVSVAIEAMKNFNVLQNPGRTQEYLDIADNELQRLSLLVDKVLKLSMFEQEQIELKFEGVDVHDVAREVITSMRIQFEQKKAQVELVAEGIDFSVFGDRLHLTSMLYNLADNALKYSMLSPAIRIVVSESASIVKLMIADNGVGIDQEYRSKIFDKFFRVPGGNKHNVKGYGLGLSYVAHIVEKHAGEVRVESEIGKGASFIIQLPKYDQKT